jgi:hypothetical protein
MTDRTEPHPPEDSHGLAGGSRKVMSKEALQ